jgi:hypothetical protein
LKLIYNEKQQSDITPRADFTTGESIPGIFQPGCLCHMPACPLSVENSRCPQVGVLFLTNLLPETFMKGFTTQEPA